MYIYIFFLSPVEITGKKIYNEKKKFCCRIGCIVKKKNFFFYCKPCNCIARKRAKKKMVVKIVLQYHFCIAGGVRLCCSIGRKIVL